MSTSLQLSDGDRSLDVVGGFTGTGIWLIDWTPPLPLRDLTYAESADSNGRRRVRSSQKNSESGSMTVGLGGSTEAAFWDAVDNFQEMVESVHANRGTLRYQPLRNGLPVTFDLEAITITEFPQQGVLMNALVCGGVKADFECRPYGRLDPVAIFTGQIIQPQPIYYLNLSGIPGQLPAWGELTITDTAGTDRGHIEVAIQEDYNPAAPEPLLLNLASGLTVSGFGSAALARPNTNYYSTSIVRATLLSSSVIVCGTTAQPHKNRWKVRTRVLASATGVRVRLAWKIGDGPITHERWVTVPNANDFFDLDLETINITELPSGHTWTGYIEASALSGSPTLDVDFVDLLPA